MANEIESVWDYPRPPRLERSAELVRVVHRGIVVAESRATYRVLETSHPPVYYIPPGDVAHVVASARRSSFCEWKGQARYFTLDVSAAVATLDPRAVSVDCAWSYPAPTGAFGAIADHLAFYASRVDECTVDGERVIPQAGDFYGGWITSRIEGPFKGLPGTSGW